MKVSTERRIARHWAVPTFLLITALFFNAMFVDTGPAPWIGALLGIAGSVIIANIVWTNGGTRPLFGLSEFVNAGTSTFRAAVWLCISGLLTLILLSLNIAMIVDYLQYGGLHSVAR